MRLRIGQLKEASGSAWALGLLLLASQADAATLYHLKVKGNPSVPMQLVFAITCPDSGANALTILDAVYDGSGQPVGTVGRGRNRVVF